MARVSTLINIVDSTTFVILNENIELFFATFTYDYIHW
jgi:hypothetical protein